MAEEEGKQEEKFEFTAEGEALGYISLEQARVLGHGDGQGPSGELPTLRALTNGLFPGRAGGR